MTPVLTPTLKSIESGVPITRRELREAFPALLILDGVMKFEGLIVETAPTAGLERAKPASPDALQGRLCYQSSDPTLLKLADTPQRCGITTAAGSR